MTLKKTRSLSCLALVMTALAITSCGSTPAGVPAPETTQAEGGDHQIATLRIGTSLTREALQAALPDAQILSFDPEAGHAILSVPGENRAAGARLTGQSLRALNVGAVTLEPDVELSAPSDPEANGLGVTGWASGITGWAAGITGWAAGAGLLPETDWNRAVAYWNALGLPRAHGLAPELGAGVKVAVLDTGVDSNHPLLQGRIDTAAGWDFVNGDAVPQEERPLTGNGKYGHGTAVAGIILQMAPNARVLPYRVLNPDGSAPMSRVVLALDRAVAGGARVVNLSLGARTDSTALNTALAAALAKGVIVVNASGNGGTEGMLYPAQQVGSAAFPSEGGLVAVGSVGPGLYKSAFTNYGANMSLTAPGEEVLTTYPGSRLVKASGTSFAAPAVTGALALAISAGTANTSTLLRDLRATTTPNLDPIYRSKLGTGTLNVAAFLDTYR